MVWCYKNTRDDFFSIVVTSFICRHQIHSVVLQFLRLQTMHTNNARQRQTFLSTVFQVHNIIEQECLSTMSCTDPRRSAAKLLHTHIHTYIHTHTHTHGRTDMRN